MSSPDKRETVFLGSRLVRRDTECLFQCRHQTTTKSDGIKLVCVLQLVTPFDRARKALQYRINKIFGHGTQRSLSSQYRGINHANRITPIACLRSNGRISSPAAPADKMPVQEPPASPSPRTSWSQNGTCWTRTVISPPVLFDEACTSQALRDAETIRVVAQNSALRRCH